MPLILEQSFPLGRYHATRWNQNPFEDRHGEWPPSPWRLLRALNARWFQYARETGDEDESTRNHLLSSLAVQSPVFYLPAFTWRADPAPRQYQKTEVAWTDASAKAAAYKKPKTTLAVDVFRAVSPNDRVVWFWEALELFDPGKNLLRELLKRILYFGRAETHCRLAFASQLPRSLARCELSSVKMNDSPVLVPIRGQPLNLPSLMASSDDRLLEGRQIPPGTEWLYASLPQRPPLKQPSSRKPTFPTHCHFVQFAVGGRVFPKQSQWVRVVERFRGCVLKHAARIVSGGECTSYRELPHGLRDKLKLLSGKDGNGMPLQTHEHAYFFLCPDEFGNPTRLIAFRRSPFDADEVQPFEIEAILAASRKPIFWQSRDPDWSLRLVPLPIETSPPSFCSIGTAKSRIWISATPFVVPHRHRFRENGRLRRRETAVELLRKALVETLLAAGSTASILNIHPINQGGEPLAARPDDDPAEFKWVTVHEPLSDRKRRFRNRERRVRPGFLFRIQFSEPVGGPLLVGHSCHFGLGLFVSASSSGNSAGS